eukprot:gene13141-8987_t
MHPHGNTTTPNYHTCTQTDKHQQPHSQYNTLNPQVTPQTLHYGNSLSNYNHLSTKLDHSYPASRPANPKSRSITIYQEHHLSQNHTPGAQGPAHTIITPNPTGTPPDRNPTSATSTHPQPPITTQNPAAVLIRIKFMQTHIKSHHMQKLSHKP